MAHLDNLIESVQDPALRTALQTELRKVLNNRQFGLVFNPHKPESILLPGFTVRRGDKVRVLQEGTDDRTEVDDTGVWVVLRIKDGVARLRAKTDPEATREAQHERLVVVREFGDPIFPGLKSTDRIERAAGDPWHTVINGENFHALQALLYPYEGRIDAIYIDPPYNTGARDWKYNNRYVDDNDPYKHSKWLSFMEKRLRLAKRLLNPSRSVLMVTIDEKEVHRLGLVLEQVFPSNKIQMVTSVINPRGVARGAEFARVEEYIYFVFIGDATVSTSAQDMLGRNDDDAPKRIDIWNRLLRRGTNSLRADRPNLFYPIWVHHETARIHSVGDAIPLSADRSQVDPPEEGLIPVWPLRSDDSEGNWSVSPPTLRQAIEEGTARLGSFSKKRQRWSMSYLIKADKERIARGEINVLGRDENGALLLEASSDVARQKLPSSVWHLSSHNAGAGGSTLLRSILPGQTFPFPKSLYAVEDALRLFLVDSPHAIVLDFFGGSGTTTHAVARLNREDGGRRTSILVTNNEVSAAEASTLRKDGVFPGDEEWEAHGICRAVTIPRIKASFTGRRADGSKVPGDYKFGEQFPLADGLDQNVEFFDLTYEDPALISLGRRFSAVAPLLWMKAGARGARIEQIDPVGWSVPHDGTYGVLFDTTKWSDFVAAVNARHNALDPISHAFIVTDSHSEYQQIVSRLDPSLHTTRLYADYLRTFEINTMDD